MLGLHSGKHYMNRCRNFSLDIVLSHRHVGNYRLEIHSSIHLHYKIKSSCQTLPTKKKESDKTFGAEHNNWSVD